MKNIFKRFGKAGSIVTIALFCFTLVVCFSTKDIGSAQTVWAEQKELSSSTVSFLESLQQANREISELILPAVVTLDVVETKTINSIVPDGFPWFFFGNPNQSDKNDNDSGSNKREYKAEGLGSGVIIKKVGNTYYLLTNQHVAGTANEIKINLHDGRQYAGILIGADERKDIALVSFETKETNIPLAKLGDSSSVKTGDIVFAIGSPLGYMSSVTQGIVSAVGRDGGPNNNINDFIQTDAAINQGNSGGPLVNIYGEVIGINSWIASSTGGSQGLGFSIPVNNIKSAIDDFISVGKIKYGWLGVSLVQADKDLLTDLGVTDKKGAFISQIFMGSPAEKGGLNAGDYITALNGNPVKSVDALVRDVGDLKAGEVANFSIINNGSEKSVKVKIEERNEKTVSDSKALWPGFTPYPLSKDLRAELKVDDTIKGVVVTGIQAKSPSAIIGLQSGDIITAVRGVKISSVQDFYAALSDASSKETWFDIVREGTALSTMRYKK